MEKSFRTSFVENGVNTMVVEDYVECIKHDTKSGNLTIVVRRSDVYTVEDLDQLSWQALKKMVADYNGEWTNKADAIEFLAGKTKGA